MHCKKVSTICTLHLQSTFHSVALRASTAPLWGQHLYIKFWMMVLCGTGRMSDLPTVTQWVGGRARTASQEPWLLVPCPAHKTTLPPPSWSISKSSCPLEIKIFKLMDFFCIWPWLLKRPWNTTETYFSLWGTECKKKKFDLLFLFQMKKSGFPHYRCLLPLAHLPCNNYSL